MLRRFSVNFAILAIVLDGVLVGAMLVATSLFRPTLNILPGIATIPSPVQVPRPLLLIFPLAWVAILGSFSLYDGKKFIRAVDEFAVLSLASCLAAISLAGVLYFSYRDFSRAQFFLFVAVSYICLVVWRVVARFAFRARQRNLSAVIRQVLVVGTGPIARMVESRIRDVPEAGMSLLGFVDDEPAEAFGGALLGRITDLQGIVAQRGVTDVIIALPPHFYGQIRAAVSCLNETPVQVWIALGFFDLALYRTVTEDFAGLPLLDLRAAALDDYERTVKRAFDLAFGAAALILAAPFLALAAVLILCFDGRPIFYMHNRVGENGRLFRMYKFRTMIVNADRMRPLAEARDTQGHLVHKARDDPRITSLGRILRRFSIDELPQLLNVLRGEMSLVGPRPELPRVVQEYQPWQRQRLAVPPGITGWWQVTGRSEKLMHLHTEDDLYYLRNYSIWLDLQIIMRTLWVVVIGRGAF